MNTVSTIDRQDTNQPKNGWLWVHDYSPWLVKLNFFVSAMSDWFFWHCVIDNYRTTESRSDLCNLRRACELVECLAEILEMYPEEQCSLWSLIWEQADLPAFQLLVGGATGDKEITSGVCSSLFCWAHVDIEERSILEEYFWRVFCSRSHVFNGGNYHDAMNWLDIYDAEINKIYRDFTKSRTCALEYEIRRKITLLNRHAASTNLGQVRRQWSSEASFLGLSEQQAIEHWDHLWRYLSQKVAYHLMRITEVESALESRFAPRRLLVDQEDLIVNFCHTAIHFCETRLQLFSQDYPRQIQLL